MGMWLCLGFLPLLFDAVLKRPKKTEKKKRRKEKTKLEPISSNIRAKVGFKADPCSPCPVRFPAVWAMPLSQSLAQALGFV